LAASLRSVEAARLRRARIPLCVPHPWVRFDPRLVESAYYGRGLPTTRAHRSPPDDRGGGLGMAEDDPGRESPGLNPEGGQRFFGFDEDISGVAVPAELPILPLRGVVIFPSAIVPLLISRGASLKLVEECLAGDRMLGLAAQKNPEDESPAPEGLYSRGTAGRILKMLKYPDQSVRILVQGLRRIEIAGFTQREPYFRAHIRHLQDSFAPSKDLDAAQAHMVNQF